MRLKCLSAGVLNSSVFSQAPLRSLGACRLWAFSLFINLALVAMILVSLAQRMRCLLRRWLAPVVCLALLWLLGAVLPAHAARLALVIGNDQYTNIERLKNARNDAKLISGVLKQAGFEVTLINDQSRIQLWSAIDSFRGRINKGDEVVFYFAGHGVQIGSNQLLLPTDIKARSELELQREGVSLVDVQDALKDARVAVLLIDACRDNPFPKQGTRSLGGTRGLSPPEPSTGQIIMMSAGRNQKALDSVPGQSISNGLFTWELAQLLQTPGLDVRAALLQVRDRVEDKAKLDNHKQRPSVVDDLRGNFFFIAPGANVTIQVSPAPAAVPLAPTVRPSQGAGTSLEDLQKEEDTRKEWAAWQQKMKADFDKIAAFHGSADLQVKAWERFQAAWGQDNPLSTDDDKLRSQAQANLGTARQNAASARPATAETAVQSGTSDYGIRMVSIPRGSFQMGSPTGEAGRSADERPQHRVNVASFLLGATEVTQGQWKAVMGSNPSRFNTCGDDCPVENVSWNDIQGYIQKLNQKSGKDYRLPSEAEWEYACRAGGQHQYCGSDNANSVAWYGENSGDKTHAAAGKQANAWGLYDMSGNVWEWVQDVYHENYNGAPTDGSAWMVGGQQNFRVLRGGSWGGNPAYLRSASRNRYTPDNRNDSGGLRLARTLVTP